MKPTHAARWLAICIATALTVAAPRAAWAHAHLVRSAPAADAHLAVAPTVVRLWYSEAAEATMTTISITGPNGSRASVGPVSVDPGDPLLLTATIDAPLPAGKYTLAWRTVAKDDGHPSSGKFSFVVDGTLPRTAVAAAPTAGQNTASTDLQQSDSGARPAATAHAAQRMDVEAPTYVLARWLGFVALITVVGAAAFVLLVLPRVDVQSDADRVAAFDVRATKQAARLGVLAAVAFLVASLWRLGAEHAVIGGNISMGTLLSSYWGHAWITQAVVAVVVCVAFASARGSRRGGVAWGVAAVAAVVLAATPALSGHAMAATQNRIASVALDVLHVVAAGAWLGTLLTLTVVGVPAALSISKSADVDAGAPGRLSLVARLVNAFSPLALLFAGLVVASGVIAAWMRIGSFGTLFHSTYGTVLLIKVGLVILVLAGGAFNWMRMRGALAHQDAGGSAVGTFRRSAWIELTAGVLVLAVTAVLVATQTPVR